MSTNNGTDLLVDGTPPIADGIGSPEEGAMLPDDPSPGSPDMAGQGLADALKSGANNPSGVIPEGPEGRFGRDQPITSEVPGTNMADDSGSLSESQAGTVAKGTDERAPLDGAERPLTTVGPVPAPESSRIPPPLPSDYAPPRSLDHKDLLIWDEDALPVRNFALLGHRLATSGDLFRASGYAGGLVLAYPAPNVAPVAVREAAQLEPIIVDRVRVRVIKDGQFKGGRIPATHLRTMLRSELFLQKFLPVDEVIKAPKYLADFRLTTPGYNDGGPGQRFLFTGTAAPIESDPRSITAFLDAMAFATHADRTNALAAALTVLLRNLWPGGKPLVSVTASKSHAGKDTVIQFARGSAPGVSISYQAADWAIERSFTGAVTHNAELGVITVENARLARNQPYIASAFLERTLTSPELFLFSTGTGKPVSRRNDLVIALSTNFGALSEDLLNRSLPIHLDPVGDVASRTSPIGNPRFEFLPAHRDRIEAELRGMIERWKEASRPLDTRVGHPFTPWARTVGGILMVNGYANFLGNYAVSKTAEDPTRQGLGLLGASRPGHWLRAAEWAKQAAILGLVKSIVPEADRDSEAGRERGIGVVLSAHRDETFRVSTEDERLTLRLEKARRRFEGGQVTTRYRFEVLTRDSIPEDHAGTDRDGAPAS